MYIKSKLHNDNNNNSLHTIKNYTRTLQEVAKDGRSVVRSRETWLERIIASFLFGFAYIFFCVRKIPPSTSALHLTCSLHQYKPYCFLSFTSPSNLSSNILITVTMYRFDSLTSLDQHNSHTTSPISCLCEVSNVWPHYIPSTSSQIKISSLFLTRLGLFLLSTRWDLPTRPYWIVIQFQAHCQHFRSDGDQFSSSVYHLLSK